MLTTRPILNLNRLFLRSLSLPLRDCQLWSADCSEIFNFETSLHTHAHLSTRMGNFSSSPGSLSSAQCTQLIEDVVSHNCVVIFSKTTCPYCKMAKNVFSEIGAAYKVIELDEHRDGKLLQEALTHITGARTVPRVFVNGKCIGGGSDTKMLHEQGKLASLVEQCAPCCANSEGSGSGHGP